MKIKKIFFIVLLLIPLSTYALDYPKMNSKVVEIYDLTDKKVIYEVKSNDVIAIASLTKIATAMVAIENIKNLDEKIIITNSMLNSVSSVAHVSGLKVGNKVTYRDLLYAILVSSGADAANSLAISCSGSLSNHVKKMNELAKKIGLEHTNFKNVTGLDEKNSYSTADDVRKLLIYALNNSSFKEIYTTKKYKLTNGLVVNTTLKLYDKNGSVDTSFIIGSKTGFTDSAGYSIAYLMDVNGHDMLIITLKATRSGSNYYHLIDATNLSKFMLKNYQDEILVQKGQAIKEIPVKLSNIDIYTITANQDVKKYLPSDYDINKLKIEYIGLEQLSFTNHKDDKIGEIDYYFDNELLIKEDVILNQKIKINLIKVLKEYYLLLIAFVLLVILSIFFIKKRKKKSGKHVMALSR